MDTERQLNEHELEIDRGQRFRFGRNWLRFLERIDANRIDAAERSLRESLGRDDLVGCRFADLGSGSGLFSLAARRLGAEVVSLDYDPESVACTRELKRRTRPADGGWVVEGGSVLERDQLLSLGHFDIVYSWGVLHHTGDLWRAMGNVVPLVREGGTLLVALYNDQGAASRRWLAVKRGYNRLPRPLRFLILWPAFLRLWGPTTVRDLARGRPGATWREYRRSTRGMSPWRDVVDWVGGYPFEVAAPDRVTGFCRDRGLELRALRRDDGHGCNEFVFVRGSGRSEQETHRRSVR
jgi:2-polyprenyl-6-hydroxyphenyl methylase/3-demethylubiquinone-9 3-methyltransferase